MGLDLAELLLPDGYTLEDLCDALDSRSDARHGGMTPVPAQTLNALENAAGCREEINSLRDEMQGDLAKLEGRLGRVEEGQEVTQDLVRELPAKFAEAAFADRDHERKDRSENAKQRIEFCQSVANKLLASKIFMSLLGFSVLAATAGIFLRTLDLRVGEWFDMSTNDRAAEARTLPEPQVAP